MFVLGANYRKTQIWQSTLTCSQNNHRICGHMEMPLYVSTYKSIFIVCLILDIALPFDLVLLHALADYIS